MIECGTYVDACALGCIADRRCSEAKIAPVPTPRSYCITNAHSTCATSQHRTQNASDNTETFMSSVHVRICARQTLQPLRMPPTI